MTNSRWTKSQRVQVKGCALKALESVGGLTLAICVLVVDDDPLVRFVAVQVLADAGFETIEAGDAAQALDVLRGVTGSTFYSRTFECRVE